jgi:hypothetical protein
MRRVISLAGLLVLAALLPMQTASAGGRIGPPLHLQLYVYRGEIPGQSRASLDVGGSGCVPLDAPASVMVTLDRAPGQVFTTKPDARGRWGLSIAVDVPVDGVYVVNATCDNYFGTTTYPTAQTDADHVILVVAGGGAGGGVPGGHPSTPAPTPTVISDPTCAFTTGCVADTGSDTSAELTIGLAALLLGALLVLLGRPRHALRPILSRRDVGRHRREH